MAKEKSDLVYGTLDMLILRALQHDPRHGLAIADRIQQMSKDILHVEQGSLYPALYRLEAQGWIKAEWGVSDNNRKARYYKLTTWFYPGRGAWERGVSRRRRLKPAAFLLPLVPSTEYSCFQNTRPVRRASPCADPLP